MYAFAAFLGKSRFQRDGLVEKTDAICRLRVRFFRNATSPFLFGRSIGRFDLVLADFSLLVPSISERPAEYITDKQPSALHGQ